MCAFHYCAWGERDTFLFFKKEDSSVSKASKASKASVITAGADGFYSYPQRATTVAK